MFLRLNKLSNYHKYVYPLYFKDYNSIANIAHNTLPCTLYSKFSRFFSTTYDKIDKEATTLCSSLDSTQVIDVLKSFISSKYNGDVLRNIFDKNRSNTTEPITINDYLLVLQVCNRLRIRDLDLVSPLSVNLNTLVSKLFSYSNKNGTLDTKLDHKQTTLAICKIYNENKILYDPLFMTISERFCKELDGFNWEEIKLLLQTYSIQRYNDVEIVKNISQKLETDDLKDLEPNVAASIYSSLSHLEYLTTKLKNRLESVFMTRGNKIHKFNKNLSMQSLLSVAYSNLLLDAPSINDLEVVLSCLYRIGEMYKTTGDLNRNFLRNFTVVVSYIKCLHRDLYDLLDDESKRNVMNLVLQFNETKKFETSIFTEKVSEHLQRMRIRCETNIYKNGILLDIVEQDQNLVWLCNSYHRFYATTFNMTADSKLLTKLIKAFGYKVSSINYYQWGRMKCKRTRFAFLRMARYYALKDKREYDPKYSGWSLPYIWWNYTTRDRLHISHYDHYNP